MSPPEAPKPYPSWFKVAVWAVLAGFVLFVAGITVAAAKLPEIRKARSR
jgi:hypothetical protein